MYYWSRFEISGQLMVRTLVAGSSFTTIKAITQSR